MDTNTLLIIVAVLALIVFSYWFWQKRRSDTLRSEFPEEYDRAVSDKRTLNKAESDLSRRQKRVAGYDLVPLDTAQQAAVTARWTDAQAQFVDDPAAANTTAQQLIGEVMEQRGYPRSNFEREAADLSVHYPRLVQHYRDAHAVAQKNADGGATTEELRRAMQDYRVLFDGLVTEDRTARD